MHHGGRIQSLGWPETRHFSVGMAVQWEWWKAGAGHRRRWYYTLRNIGCWSEIFWCRGHRNEIGCSVGQDDARGREEQDEGIKYAFRSRKLNLKMPILYSTLTLKPHSKTQELITRACQGAGGFVPILTVCDARFICRSCCWKLHSDWSLAVTSSSYIHHCTLCPQQWECRAAFGLENALKSIDAQRRALLRIMGARYPATQMLQRGASAHPRSESSQASRSVCSAADGARTRERISAE